MIGLSIVLDMDSYFELSSIAYRMSQALERSYFTVSLPSYSFRILKTRTRGLDVNVHDVIIYFCSHILCVSKVNH